MDSPALTVAIHAQIGDNVPHELGAVSTTWSEYGVRVPELLRRLADELEREHLRMLVPIRHQARRSPPWLSGVPRSCAGS